MLSVLVQVSMAATLSVGPGQPYGTIAAALTAASDGDRIEVDPGTYSSTVTIGKDVEIVGLGGAAQTTWSGAANEDVVTVDGGVVSIEGFTMNPGLVGRAFDVEQGEITLVGIEARNQDSQFRNGGVLRLQPGTIGTVDGCTFAENTVAQNYVGGHIYAEGAELVVTGSTFETGDADQGGAIYATDTIVTITSSTFDRNASRGNGGAIALLGAFATLDGLTVVDNEAVGDWGGDALGGGIWASDSAQPSEVDLQNSTFEGNTASTTGGGVQLDGGASATIGTTTFVSNASGYGGGVFHDGDGDLTLDACTFTGNEATDQSGGGLRWHIAGAARETITDCTFDGNTAASYGGAVAVVADNAAAGDLTIEGGWFEGNEADEGGALSLTQVAVIHVHGAVFCVNRASVDGGAVRLSGGATVASTFTNNVFDENDGGPTGGAIHADNTGDTDIVNNTFLANGAGSGGGVAIDGSDVDFRNNLVAVSTDGYGLTLAGNAGGALAYSRFFDNQPDNLPPGFVAGPTVTFDDPGLVAFTADGNCRNDQPWPAPGSSMIDGGDPAITDPDGSPSDIGAFGGPGADDSVFADEDGDGWSGASDCDDGDASVNPDAAESCDGVDQDCNGIVDDGVAGSPAFFPDGDGDGYGVEAGSITACTAPEGYAAASGDCDDALAAIHPDATELCNLVDDDCDGSIDEDAMLTWYEDLDGDGYGAGVGIDSCDPVAGRVSNGGDCDDADPALHPDADDPEGDGIDQNCDGADGIAVGTGTEDLKVSSGCGCDHGTAGPALLLPLALGAARRRRRGARRG